MSDLTFSEYQGRTSETAIYPGHSSRIAPGEKLNYDEISGLSYVMLGLVSEVGEVAGKVKKIGRDKDWTFSQDDVEGIGSETADILWYCAQLATLFGVDLGDVAQLNLDKLKSRKERGVLQGSGDNR